MASNERAQRLSPLQNGVIGSLAGLLEVLLQQPTIAIKNSIQQGRPVNWSVPVLYRGVGVTLASIAPISAIQFAVNGKLLVALNGSADKEHTSDLVKIASGALSGVASAVLSGPAELAMTLQQNTGKSFGSTIVDVAKTHGASRLFRGLGVTALRDSVWCACYLALGPVVTRKLHALSPGVFGSEEDATASQRATASVAGSILAGIVTVYATQPVDTVKTIMQGEAMSVHGRADSTLKVFQRVWRDGGIQRFYRGSVPRGGRLIGAVFILGQSRIFLEELFDDHEILKM